MSMTIGIDVGNFDTKSKNTNTVSGYTSYNSEQLLADKVLGFNGKYYIESQDNRIPYTEDKTANDQCLILTLFGVAKEILWRIENEKHIKGNFQSEISNVNGINLAVGLPPGHFNKLAIPTKDYYNKKFADGIKFTYAGYKFNIKLNRSVEVYAQGLSAVIMDNTLFVNEFELDENGNKIFVYPKYYIMDIGGGTVELIPIKNGMPAPDECNSKPMGTRPMFESIITRIQASSGITLEETTVENVLRGRKSFLKDDVKEQIFSNANQYADYVIDKYIQAGCTFDQCPIIFVGGGSLLLKPYLEKNTKICASEFIMDTHANAASYEKFMKIKYNLSA